MDKVLLLLFAFVLFAQTTLFQNDHFIHRMTHERLKNAINRGAHDASLQIDPLRWAEGFIEFVPDRALQVFKETTAANIGLNPGTMAPLPHTMLTHPIEVLFEDYIDDKDPVTYPYIYRNATYGIEQTIYGPAVVYVVRVLTPQISATSSDEYILKSVVFEYPYPK